MDIAEQYPIKKVELHGKLAEFRQALEEEIDKIKKSVQSSTLLFGGRKIESNGADYWYRFNVEYLPSLPADTPCKLLVGKEHFDVIVISFEENSIVIASKNPLPDTIAKALLENGATVLMERLIKRIEENAENDNPAGNRMLDTGDTSVINGYHEIESYKDIELSKNNNDSQNQAVIAALVNDITYIWGPPGTGKTTVIGQIINELFKHDRSVLVVSHTNTAVDGAIEKVDDVFYTQSSSFNETFEPYPILRIGNPVKALPERVLLKSHVKQLGKELYTKEEELEIKQQIHHQRLNEIEPDLLKSTWIENSLMVSIGVIVDNIHNLNKSKIEVELKRNTLNHKLDNFKDTHPEYIKHIELNNLLSDKEVKRERILTQIDSLFEIINRIPEDIRIAKDEVKKHEKYKEFRSEEEKQMSAAHLISEISKASQNIKRKNTEKAALLESKRKYEKTLSDFENKGVVAKFFADKYSFIKTKTLLDQETEKIHQIESEIQIHTKLEQEYKKQLDDLILLQERIKAVTPSKTQQHWQNQIIALSKQLNTAQYDLHQLYNAETTIEEEILTITKELNDVDKAYAEYEIIESQINDINTQWQQLIRDISCEHNKCVELLELEYKFCASFFECNSKENEKIYTELLNLQRKTREDLLGVNIQALKSEKEVIEKDLLAIHKELADIKQKMLDLEKQAILQAKVFGATLAKSYLNDTLRKRNFDTVILDEASMASIPALWCACYLADRNVIIVGDFLQLPPIVMADTPMAQKWLGKDIFFHSGMQERAKIRGNKIANKPDNFIMLNEQFRMEKEIADIANEYYAEYGSLRSKDFTENRIKERSIFYNWFINKQEEHCVHLIDTENLHAWVTGVPQGKSHSRFNCFSAAVSVELAFSLLKKKIEAIDINDPKPTKEPSVLIVAPYKPHVARLRQLVELGYKARGFTDNLELIRVGTIHSFQGSEADIVIFDLVVDEPHWKANLFMPGKDVNEDLEKMFNVAITRAKFKLYLVGNFSYCMKHAKHNALHALLNYLLVNKKLPKVDAKEAFPDITYALPSNYVSNGEMANNYIICREDSFYNYFMEDVRSFSKRLIIYSPFITSDRLSSLLPFFADAIKAKKSIIIITKALSDRKKAERAQYRKYENELKSLGVTVLHKKGMHEKLAFADNEVVWVGSLNILSFTGFTGEVMFRYKDENLTTEYADLFDIDHICEVVDQSNEQKCPICGGEMLISESDNGGIYWACINKDYTRNTDQQYPADGILLCKCGAPYIYAMKNQPRWVCSENPNHYQVMRYNDLKLEKMAELIPTKKELIAVQKYFQDKRKEHEKEKPKATLPTRIINK